ncbi:MAG: hypothetical protein KGL39_42415 [Patescibacteria group bacterium]|nr:hypothetical protein [Patescibacteria group bacterium]
MSWPRFRGRNNLIQRPNYYSGGTNAPAAPEGAVWPEGELSEYERTRLYLSGEIDRMVYGWWLSEPFQQAVASAVGIDEAQVAAVMDLMLTADFLWNGELAKSSNWKGLP